MNLLPDTVVIAEDDLEVSQMIKSHFELNYGLSVSTTDRVDKILPLVLGTKASVLIMDLQLSDGDASQVLSSVAAIDGLLVVILTGTYDGRQEDLLLRDGAQVVMRKPQKPSAIWQQVLNLRGIRQQRGETVLRIQVRGQKAFYEVMDGAIVGEGGNRIYLEERRRAIMEILARSMTLNEKERKFPDGWVNRTEVIQNVFGTAAITYDISRSFGYHIREIKKTLGECMSFSPDMELIENRRAGRSESYYRLNPDLFVPVTVDSDG